MTLGKAFTDNNLIYSRKSHTYKGHLKYTAICGIGRSGEFVMSGGCNTMTNEATNEGYSFRINDTRQIRMISPLELARYGHCSIFCNGYIFVIGGFSMDDNIDAEPNTLSSGEKYHFKEDMWAPAASLNVSRAYAGVVTFKSKSKKNKLAYVKGTKKVKETMIPSYEYIYLFAGLNDFVLLDSIEKYDAMLDIWTLLSIKTPIKIAKIGVCVYEQNNSILVGGGIHNNQDDEFVYVDLVYKLDMNVERWSEMPSMNESRVLYPGLPYVKDRIYAIGGSFNCGGEYFDLNTQVWVKVKGYENFIPENDIQTFAVINYYNI